MSYAAVTTMHDKATVAGSFRPPTGPVTFTFCTTSSTCTGTSVASGTVTSLHDALPHSSASQGPLSAGSYSFIAHYNGDPNYTATDSPCEPLEVTALTPTALTEIHNASHNVVVARSEERRVGKEGRVRGPLGQPTGKGRVTLFTTSSTCTGTSVASCTVTLDGSDVALLSDCSADLCSSYHSFIAHYNGDPNYTATDSPCEPLEVTALTPTALTEIHNASHNVVVA